MTTETYSSIPDTRAHQDRVVELMAPIVTELAARARAHEESKMCSPEVEVFDVFTPKLSGAAFGSGEYFRNLEEMKPALDHHFAHNDHHPQHWPGGVADMHLLALMEMLVDWRASQERNPDGSMRRSLEINAERFSIPQPLLQVLRNTAIHLGWLEADR